MPCLKLIHANWENNHGEFCLYTTKQTFFRGREIATLLENKTKKKEKQTAGRLADRRYVAELFPSGRISAIRRRVLSL